MSIELAVVETPQEQQTIVETAAQRAKRLFDEKANDQLRQNRRTASHKLNRKIMFSLLVETGRGTCVRCSCDLTEDTFSIDHMENWLNSEDPRGLFFDIKNIDFSCKVCNSFHNRGKFGTRDKPVVVPEKVWSVRVPLLHKHEINHEPVQTKIGLLERIKALLNTRISWVSE